MRSRIAVCIAGVVLLAGCSVFRRDQNPVQLAALAVLPLEAVDTQEGVGNGPGEPLPADAGHAVTAQIYRVLADQTRYQFVPDLVVSDALFGPDIRRIPSLTDRARALGVAVAANGVIFGRVFRFRERVGGEFVATQPASVSFELGLLHVETGEVVWTGDFQRTQRSLGSSFMRFLTFWENDPHWLTARELAGVGVEQLLEDAGRHAVP